MSAFLDLNAVAGPDTRVALGDAEYLLPADPEAEIIVAMLELADRFEALGDDGEDEALGLLKEMQERVLDLFRIRQPELESLPLGLSQIQRVFFFTLGIYDGDAEPDPPKPRPTRSRKNGQPSRAPRKPKSAAS